MIASSLRAALWIAIVAAVCSGPTLGQAAEEASQTRNVGPWDLKLDSGLRQCRMVLRADLTGPGYAVGMPVGCHLAFPFLASVKMWNEVGDARLQLEDAKGETLIAFEPGPGGLLTGAGPGGEALQFEPVGLHKATVLKTAVKHMPAADVVAKASVAEPVKTVSKLPRPTIVEMAGHYSVLRKDDKDTGCMVTLDQSARGPNGTLKANLAPACRDQGLVIFDPVGWQLEAGRLVLTARKGHTTKLEFQDDGSWLKQPLEGKGLSLKRM